MARKQQPGKLVKTAAPGIYKRSTAKGAVSYIVRIYNPETKGRDDYTAVTFQQAKDLKADAERNKRLRKRVGSAQMTVAEWANRWLELFPRRESTNLHNTERISQYVRDFGPRLLPGCTSLEAHEWAAQHPARVRATKAFLNDARRVRLIDDNPFEGIDRGKKASGRRGITVLTEPELAKLVATASLVHGSFGAEVLAPMIEVLAGTGIRPGELYAMDAECVDLDAKEVHVWRQFNGKTRKLAILKGTGLERRVPMLPRAVRALEGMEMASSGPIWRSVRDAHFKHREMSYWWPAVRATFTASLPESHHLQRRARKEIPGGPLDPYEMRHSYATALAQAGATPFEIAYALGHQDGGKLAMDTYVHVAADDARASLKDRLRRAA